MLPELTSLEGLHNLTSVGEAVTINNCNNLINLNGLRGLKRAGVRVFFGNLPITSLHGLEALAQIGEPGGESRIGLHSLPGLTSLDGLAIDWQPEHDIWLYRTGLTDMSTFAGVTELTASTSAQPQRSAQLHLRSSRVNRATLARDRVQLRAHRDARTRQPRADRG